MHYFSTRDKNHQQPHSFAQAVLRGLAADGGLFLPERLPQLPADFFQQLPQLSKEDIGLTIARAFIENEIPEDELRRIVTETLAFPIPAVPVADRMLMLELFHGPTMAFKDVGARFMARVLGYFAKQQAQQPIKIVVATSGDTGSAVASGFFNVPGIEVYILYPKGKVSPLQEKQLTTWGGNITALEVNGSFDDCQALAKKLLNDTALQQEVTLSSANSINIARLIPQSFYYALAVQQHHGKGPLVIAVPSGNLGNLTAGILLKQMGLPVAHFIAASNANAVFPDFLHSGHYHPQPSTATLSNAMDVGAPSNFERLQYLFQDHLPAFQASITGVSISDEVTRATMQQVYADTGYILDPHGAVGYAALAPWLTAHPDATGMVLGTAHPAKFVEVVEETLGQSIAIPETLQAFARKEKRAIPIEVNYEALQAIIRRNTGR
ncbi:MAG: threonine synthase [Chitinophagales bacterium]